MIEMSKDQNKADEMSTGEHTVIEAHSDAPPDYTSLGKGDQVKTFDATAQTMRKLFVEKPDYAPPDYIGVVESDDAKTSDFKDERTQRAFLAKVYAILTCQLLVMKTFMVLFMYKNPMVQYYNTYYYFFMNSWVFCVSLAVALACFIIVFRYGNSRRQPPMSNVYLGIFTLAECLVLGALSTMIDVDWVPKIVVVTALVCFALTGLALQTKWQFTTLGAVLICTIIALSTFNLLVLLSFTRDVISLFFITFFAFLVSMYFVHETQLMVSGQHRLSITPEEYVFAVFTLKRDVITVYPCILSIIRAYRNRNKNVPLVERQEA